MGSPSTSQATPVDEIAASLARNNVQPSVPIRLDSSVPDDLEGLMKQWAAGEWVSITDRSTPKLIEALVNNMPIDQRVAITPEQEGLLRSSITSLLFFASSTDFDDYLLFRGTDRLAESDSPQIQRIMDRIKSEWSTANGPQPTTVLEGVKQAFRFYVNGRGGNQPMIQEINPNSLRAVVRSLTRSQYEPAKWESDAGTDGILYQEIMMSKVPFVSMGVYKLAVPNRTSVADIMKQHGSLTYFDCDMRQRSSPDPAASMRFRFYWDPNSSSWLPLQGATFYNQDRVHLFFW